MNAINPENFIKIAADSVMQLRRIDVYRVLLEAYHCGALRLMADYILGNRPDLRDEVADCQADLIAEMGVVA